MYRDEYRAGDYGVRDYYITIFGIPIYSARFTSTNNQAVRTLTILKENTVNVKGFTTNNKYKEDEAEDIS